ncbi:MAG: hypothetical protein PVS3B1_28390 [Ktedonobacteraceae bacterium]
MEQFGNYELVRRIAVGGMGEVYLARQRTAFGREVAVKIIRLDLMHDVVARKRFLREAEVGAYLKHDHILSMLEFGEEQGRLFIVTPYVKGGTLAQRLERGALSLAEVHELFSSLVQAVSYLHKRDVIHRDLKPSNILLDREDDANGRVRMRLIDFGIAAMQGSQMSAPLTMAGQELGTEAFMAPERLNGSVSPSNDIYSLGVILYLMLTGHLPEEQDPQVLPQPLERVIARSIADDPADRFASADELLQAFEVAYRALTSSRPRPSSPTTPATPASPANAVPRSSEPDKPPLVPQQPSIEGPRFLREMAQDRAVLPPSEKYAQRRAMAERASGPYHVPKASDPSLLVPERSPARVQRGRGADSSGRVPTVSNTSSVDSSGRIPIVPDQPTSNSGRIPSVPVTERPVQRVNNAAGAPAQQGELKLPPLPGKAGSFSHADYDAPTSHLAPEEKEVEEKQLADVGVISGVSTRKPARPKKGVRRSFLALITVLILALLLGLGGVGYLIYVATLSASVTVTPRVQLVSGVFTMTARPGIKELDLNAAAIPANVLTSTQSGTQQGTATGVSGCVMQIFECKQTVSYADVDTTANKIIPALKAHIVQDLRSQTSAAGGMMVGNVFYPDPNISSDPQPHTVSPTVNVTVSQQGSVEYVKTSDVRRLAAQLLTHKLQQNYKLMDDTVQVGQPVIRGVDQKGNVTIAIAAAGDSNYDLSADELASIQNHIKGMTQKEAQALLARDPKLDPQSLAVLISHGDRVPTNSNQIKMIKALPVNPPPVRLPTVPSS